MITIKFFAQTKEIIGSESLEVTGEFATIIELKESLVTQGPQFKKALNQPNLLVALNQTMSPWDAPLKAGDEVAFFPPVTGG